MSILATRCSIQLPTSAMDTGTYADIQAQTIHKKLMPQKVLVKKESLVSVMHAPADLKLDSNLAPCNFSPTTDMTDGTTDQKRHSGKYIEHRLITCSQRPTRSDLQRKLSILLNGVAVPKEIQDARNDPQKQFFGKWVSLNQIR